jgi:hypothetical protein
MKSGISAVLAASLLMATPCLAAADSQDQGTLAPGGAAGVQQAQEFNIPIALSLVGVLGVGVAVVFLVSGAHHSATKTASSK